jgi:pimeloyl-ACP methyl ester carboxylesterase
MPFANGPGGARIHYEVHEAARGDADTCVMVQGLGLSSRFWFDLPERLVAGADRPLRVVTMDNRGVGRSDRPRGPYAMRTLAGDVVAVLDAARVDRAYVVGISLGGMIAQHVAIRHPSRVRGLVLLATTAGLPYALPPGPRHLGTLLTLPIRSTRRIGRSLARLLLSAKDAPRASELLAQWPALMHTDPTSLRVYYAQLAAVLGHSTGLRLRRVTCPTAVVTGDDDVLVPPYNSRVLAELVPGAHLEVLPDCGHAIPASDPQCIPRALARVRARSRPQMESAPVLSR